MTPSAPHVCRLEIEGRLLDDAFSSSCEIIVLGFWEECGRQLKLERNDGGDHQEWSLRLNLIQHGKTHQIQK